MSKLILIAGGSGSGKTIFSENLIANLDGSANLIAIDNYYKEYADLTIEEKKKIDWDSPETIDWDKLRKDIKALTENKSIEMPLYDYIEYKVTGTKKLEPKEYIIVEGIFGLSNKELNDEAFLKLFIDTKGDIRLLRRIQRDTIGFGIDLEFVLEKWETNIRPAHLALIEPTKYSADIIINNTPAITNENAINIITKALKEKLNE